jgi:hypothetical protein
MPAPTSAALLWLLACDPYPSVARTDTIEAYQGYLAEHPTGANALRAQVRLEELVLERARASGSLEDWDAYLAAFPDGYHRETALKERETSLFTWARNEATVEAWDTFLREYPRPGRGRKTEAEDGREAAAYAVHLTTGPVVIDKVNLADDPAGPLDGTRFRMDVTHGGDKAIETLWYRIHYLDAAGRSLDERTWPLVAPYKTYPVPVPDEQTFPMEPGETRTWEWSTGALPEGFADKVRVVPYEIHFVGEE